MKVAAQNADGCGTYLQVEALSRQEHCHYLSPAQKARTLSRAYGPGPARAVTSRPRPKEPPLGPIFTPLVFCGFGWLCTLKGAPALSSDLTATKSEILPLSVGNTDKGSSQGCAIRAFAPMLESTSEEERGRRRPVAR